MLQSDPNNAEYYVDRAQAFFQSKMFEFALRDANQALKYNPKSIPGYNIRAAIHVSSCRYDLALKDYALIQEIQPSL